MSSKRRKKPKVKGKKPSAERPAHCRSKTEASSEHSGTVIWWYVAGLLALVLFVFWQCRSFDFVYWDDPEYTTKNPFINAPVQAIFSNFYFANYHPLTLLVYKWIHGLSDFTPSAYHTVNILFHLANTFLCFQFFRRLVANKYLLTPLLCAAVFGLHPFHVESVAWVSELKDVLYTFFFWLTLLVYLRYIDKKKDIKWLLIAALFFILSCFAKAAAIVLPVVLFIVDYYRYRTDWKRSILEKIPLLAISLLFGVLAIKSQQGESAVNANFYENGRFLVWGLYSMAVYLYSFLLPHNLCGVHPYPVGEAQGDPPGFVYGIALISILFLAFLIYRYKNRSLLTGGLFFIVTIFLTLKFMPVGDAIIGERYTYVPYAGLAFALGMLIERKWFTVRHKAGIVLVAVPALMMAFISHQRCGVWKDSAHFWQDVVAKYPTYWRGYHCLGQDYYEKGMYEEAEKMYTAAIENDPYCPPVPYLWRAAVRIDQTHNYPDAIKDCKRSMAMSHSKMEDTWLDAKQNLGLAYHRMAQYDSAITQYNELLTVVPKRSKGWYLLGLSYQRKGDAVEAEKNYTRAIKLDPANYQALLNRGVVRTDVLAKYDAAIADFNKVLQINPANADAAVNIGLALYKNGDYQSSIDQYTRVLGANAAQPRVLYLRALAYAAAGDYARAVADGLSAQKGGVKIDTNLMQSWKQRQ